MLRFLYRPGWSEFVRCLTTPSPRNLGILDARSHPSSVRRGIAEYHPSHPGQSAGYKRLISDRILLRWFDTHKPPDEVIPAPAHHVVRSSAISMIRVGNHE